jgi:site-specific recombinase XerD
MVADMELCNLRPATQAQYLTCARKLAEHYRRSPAELGETEVRAFLHHLITERSLKPSTVGVYSAALRFLYQETLRRPEVTAALAYPRRIPKVPEVLSGSEVERLLDELRSSKQRALATTMYAAGLRVSEACRLKTETSTADACSFTCATARAARTVSPCSVHDS